MNWMLVGAGLGALSSFASQKAQNEQAVAEAESIGKASVQTMKNVKLAAQLDHEILEDKQRASALQTSISKFNSMREALKAKGTIKASEGSARDIAAANVSADFDNDIINENYEQQEEALVYEHMKVDATAQSRYNDALTTYNQVKNTYISPAVVSMLNTGTSAMSGAMTGYGMQKAIG